LRFVAECLKDKRKHTDIHVNIITQFTNKHKHTRVHKLEGTCQQTHTQNHNVYRQHGSHSLHVPSNMYSLPCLLTDQSDDEVTPSGHTEVSRGKPMPAFRPQHRFVPSAGKEKNNKLGKSTQRNTSVHFVLFLPLYRVSHSLPNPAFL